MSKPLFALVAAVFVSAAVVAETADDVDDGISALSGCPLRYQTPLHFSDWESLDHLVITVEGPDCASAEVVFRLFDSGGAEIFRTARENTTFGSIEGPFDPLETTLASHEWLHERYLDALVIRSSWLGAYDEDGAETSAPAGELDGPMTYLYPLENIDEATWERARAEDAPLWCYVPETHAAICMWLDDEAGEARELAYAAW